MLSYAQFNRLRGYPSRGGWGQVVVMVDRERAASLDQLHRGPHWRRLDPGNHHVEVLVGGGRPAFATADLEIAEGRVIVVNVWPAEFWPFGRGGAAVSLSVYPA